ncbi:collagen alpha-5(VI) chain-like, partial [Physella acuta]|uniref:collagen alpha-5(VI) chain-like n=1 Tax=Physella acuta TaxID=109671 RepID=UPI0027DC4D5C
MFVGTLLPWIIVIIASLHAKKNQSPEDFTSQITSADDGDQTEESESDKIVIFIVDASDQWKVKKTSQNLLDSVMEKLKYSNDKVKFAVVYVSEKSARLFDFRKITDLTVVNETLNGDQYKTLASAKELVDLTLSWNECKPKLEGEIAEQCAMTIISDGESEFFNNENVFTQWKDAGNRILIVGIGGKATGPAFTTLASKPKDLLLVQSSSKLLAVQNKLIERLEVIEDDDEEEDYDEDEQLIIYLVDSKEDLGKEELKSQRKLLMSIMTVQKEDNAKVKFAVVDVLHNSARLFDFRDQSDLKEIEKMLKKDDYAVLSNAKELIDYTMDWKECNPKRKKKCVMAIVSDGKSQFYQKVEDFSKWKNSGHKIVVVGIGNNFKKSKLAVLATEEDDLILVQSHDKLGTIVRELNHRIDEQHSKTSDEDSRSSESGGKGTSNSGQRSETSGEDSRSSESGGNGTSNSGNGPSVEAKEQVQIFILDATKNTENVDLKSQIKFITQVIKKLKENNKEVKFAVAFVFENSAKFFDLRNFTSLTRLDKILKGDKYVSVYNLAELIKITMTWEQCREKNNEETSNQCVMTIISDGQSKFFENGDEVTEWKDIENGIVVIVVGKDGKNNSIADLASSPDNAIFIESPDELETIKSQLLEKLDDENSQKKHEENVETKIVIFVTDSSKKKLLRDSDIEIIFLISAMKKLQKKNDKIRFAVVNVMGSSAGLFDLRNQTDILVIEKILKKNDYIAASSVKKLLHLIMSWEECRPKKNEKTSAQCTITFISNGKAEFLDDVEEFSKWKESGNKIVIVGIGKEFPNTAISNLASTEDDLIHVQSPYELPTVENNLIEILETKIPSEETQEQVHIFILDATKNTEGLNLNAQFNFMTNIIEKQRETNDKITYAVVVVSESKARLFDIRNVTDYTEVNK